MTNPLRCAIIDDEFLAQELLKKYVRRVTSLELIATFDDAIIAFNQLPDLLPDVIFLDITMPELTGLEFLRAYPAPHPAVIMTTANPEHALDGFDLGVTDYLLKPISFERFLKAIGRAREKKTSAPLAGSLPEQKSLLPPVANPTLGAEFIYFKTDRKLEQVRVDDIVFAESLGDYLKIFLADRYLVVLLTMKKLVDTLPADRFLRVHRSCIIQLRHIQTLEGNTIHTSTGQTLVVGPNYRAPVREAVQKWLTV
ncbi:response regulator transcription factor [Spirosoma sp. KCTC 42546]|uniref:LytR/AlgR family response regulator transcription factor n=1 Tax=Spirosoma sp. KCTC 42546 TaxID=2520506 RepID=UPI00115A33CE|nr:LytTR family DNA-binding domain-containing protein [Spirosoma sp. KCTC 42546]QDK82543.1 response regulator transcription factor [Spirosoma sp. KCTC 42546]